MKSLGRYVEDDWKQMPATVRREPRRGDGGFEGYLSFKDTEIEVRWPFMSRGKDQKGPFLSSFEERNHEDTLSACRLRGQLIALHKDVISVSIY